MKLINLHYDGASYGQVWTSVKQTSSFFNRPIVRIEQLEPLDLAALAADILGESQPYTRHEWRNLARWVLRYGTARWGEQFFLQATARALIWHRGIYETAN